MAQRRCATPRIADEPVLVPLRASPRRRSTRPGCENALPDAERCWSRSHRGGAPTPTKPLRSGCEWRSAGALHPVLRTSWCSSLPGDHRTVAAPAPGAKTCWPRSQRGGAPTRAKLGTSSTSSMSGFDQTTKRQPALAPCPTGKKNPPAANSRGIVWSMARSAADFRRADQEACQCRQQPQGAEHVPQEHEGQQDTHVSLEFDVREDPGCHTDGQGKAGKGYRLAGGLQRFVVGLLQRQALTQVGFQTAVDIDTVVNTNTHTQRDHRQGRHLHANAQEGHQRVGQNRGQRQRDDDTEYRRDRTEGRQTHQDHHHVHGDQHLDLGLLDDHVGSSLDTRVTGSQFELQVLVVVLLGKGFDLSGHALEGFSLVVVEEHHHRCQGAGSVEHAFRSTADGGVQVVLVTRQGLPFQAALVVTHDHLLGDRHQDTADCTPDRLAMRHSSWSMASMVSYAEHISGGVLTITTSTYELVE